MAKATVQVTYKNFPIGGVWHDNWIVKNAVHALESRTELQEGDTLRVIVVKDEGQETLFLQGDEVELVAMLLRDCAKETWISDDEYVMCGTILDKLK